MANATRDLDRESYWRMVLHVAAQRTLGAGLLPGGGRDEPTFYCGGGSSKGPSHKTPAFLPVHVVSEESSRP